MRIRGLLTVSAVIVGGFMTAGSSTGVTAGTEPPPAVSTTAPALSAQAQAVLLPPAGLVPPTPRVARSLRAAPPPLPPIAVGPGAASPTIIAAPLILSALGIPEIVLNAYRAAELEMMASAPDCGLPWHLLAGIGRIESGHAGGGRTDSIGTTITPILGPVLDGRLAGNAVITDSDGGVTDGDTKHDRAVGPMQFIPSTWSKYASDGNADGAADPNNVFDAALAAAKYLCSGGLDLRDRAEELRAVLRYNHSAAYAANVIGWSNTYKNGGTPIPGQLPGAPTPGPGRLADAAADGSDLAAGMEPPVPATTTPPPPIPGLPQLPPLPCLLFCQPPPHVAPIGELPMLPVP